MKLKEYLEWKHQKKLNKGGKKKNGSTKRKNKIDDNDPRGN